MLIILEGPDGGGKTYLAGQLHAAIRDAHPADDVRHLHAKAPTRHPLDEYLRPLTSYRPGTGVHYVLDRWNWGEDVYPTVRGRPTQLDEPARWAIEAYLRRLGALVVYCTGYTDSYRDVYAARGESLDQLNELPQVDRLYRVVTRQTLLPWQAFNWQSPVNGCLAKVLDSARYAQLTGVELNEFTTYSGPRWPQFLLFGDTRGPKSTPEDPAFVPFPATSGHFLHGALADADASRLFGVANACDVDDPVKLWRVLGRPPVAALGRNAQRMLRAAGVPHGAVPHPQYVRRFHNSRRSEYGRLIGRALTTREDLASWPASSPAPAAGTSTLRFSKTSAVAA